MSPRPLLEPDVLVLGGPTASGKSELAAELAGAVGGAVVSADSRQVYRGMELGTAQPSATLRARAPHYLLGILSPAAHYDAARYGTDALRVLAALRRAGRPAVVCGGTGLYLRSLLAGIPEPALERDASISEHGRTRRERRMALAERWNVEGPEAMHAELAAKDPALARRLHPRDRQRVLRGIEFHAEHGVPLSSSWTVAQSPAAQLASEGRRRTENGGEAPDSGASRAVPLRFWLDVPGAELERRIELRLERMLEAGFVAEARALHDRYGSDPQEALNAVGYPELFRAFRGETSLDDALAEIRLRTRQYAKRQRTWFRNQDGYRPIRDEGRVFETLLEQWRERLR